ncbi:hypothetical protein ACHAWU_006479 [Discostella pseudostelligera]|uniref:Uncharacterized protein n=1 Tax=Discostella pseudostelligera TaxID=259834 RepID=A0ABD3N528_9STRA
MEITIDRYRILHLILLIVCSHVIARFLINSWEWTPLSAYGLAVTVTTQISNAITQNNINAGNNDEDNVVDKRRQEKRERVLMKRRERKSGLAETKRK